MCISNCASGGTAEHTDWVLKPNQEYRRTDGYIVIGTTSASGIFIADLTNESQPQSAGHRQLLLICVERLNQDLEHLFVKYVSRQNCKGCIVHSKKV
ncbi:DUF1554 domain-containing protein [Leptospira meyeri]|uniref:DUF1554 domain-containing protein n=1 Tax=Leptospira meyeri TaxID=29508 RepID=UPI0010847382|nr:DUF1554 domain-containing protein [Leptospira meyeri]TGL16191.1 DUF1554 domain-containing protein [Leptospira meyeri]